MHELFQTWRNVEPEVLATLLPSMRLASNLIQVGLPYIASFLPSTKKDFWRKDKPDPWPSTIPLNPNPTQKEISEAERDLKHLARDLTWHASDEIYPKWGYLGVTRLVDTEEPWEEIELDDVMASDKALKSKGKQRRPLFIGIMKEYVTALEKSDLDSESNIRATFMAAITMAHEIGHAIFQNDFRAFNTNREPYVGDDCEAEIGFSFIAWIFSGFHPQSSPQDVEFTDTLYWEPQYTLSMGKRPLYKTYYSLPIAYLEQVLSQDFWDSLGPLDQPWFSERARKALCPDSNEQSPHVATGTKPNWTWSHLHDKPVWNEHNRFRMKRFRERDRIEGLTKEEIRLEYDLTKDDPLNRKYHEMTKEQRKKLYRNMRATNKGSDSPNQDDTETGLEDSDESQAQKTSKPTTSKLAQPIPISKIINTINDEDQDDPGPPVRRTGARKRTIEEMSRQLLIRGAEINGLVTGPPSTAGKWPRLGSSIMEDIDDYEAVIDLTKEERREEKGGMGLHEDPRGMKRRRVGNARPQPPSHMKDIYDLIIINDDTEDDHADDEE